MLRSILQRLLHKLYQRWISSRKRTPTEYMQGLYFHIFTIQTQYSTWQVTGMYQAGMAIYQKIYNSLLKKTQALLIGFIEATPYWLMVLHIHRNWPSWSTILHECPTLLLFHKGCFLNPTSLSLLKKSLTYILLLSPEI